MRASGIEVLFLGSNFARLLEGLWVTVRISLLAVLLSLPLGILFGLFMTLQNPIAKAVSRVYLEFIRIMPQLVLLFIAYFGVTRAFGWNWDAEFSAVLVFTLWGTEEMGDLYIIIPQTLRRLLPPTINLTTRMIKTTSLVVLIGITEVLKVGKQIIDVNRFQYPTASLWVYGAVFVLYFLACWPISLLAKYLEKRWR